uniref:OB_NTP_bind domain-containing protein n=1 Tax=Heligmosomoides polygyrus TaxID=6339 RepID=A0A183GIH6_HELPZ
LELHRHPLGKCLLHSRSLELLLRDQKVDVLELLTRGQSSNASETSRLEKAKQLLAHFQVRHFSDVVLTNEKIFTIEPPPNRQNQAIASSGKKSLKRRLASNRLFLKVSWLRLSGAPFRGSKSTKAVLDARFTGYVRKDLWLVNPIDFSVWELPQSKISYTSVDGLNVSLQKAWKEIETDYLRLRDQVSEGLCPCRCFHFRNHL